MTKTFIFATLFFALTAAVTYGQPVVPKDVKALYKQLAKSNADISRVGLLVKISRYDNAASDHDPALLDSALVTASRAIQLAGKLSYPEGTGLGYQVMAQTWSRKKNFKKSDELIRKAIKIFLDHSLFEDAAEAYLNMEEFYLAAGGHDYNVMIRYYEQAAPLFIKAGAKLRAGATFSMLGDFYLQIDSNNRGIADLQKALVLYKSAGNKQLQSVYDLLGVSYLFINNFKESLKYALLAVKTAEALRDTSMLLCTIYNRTGMIYFATYQYEQANDYYKKSIAVAKKYNDRSAIYLSSNLASNLVYQNKPVEALELLRESELHFPDIKDENRILYDAVYLQAYLKLKRYADAAYYNTRLLKIYFTKKHGLLEVIEILDPILEYLTNTKQYVQAAKYLPEYKNAAIKIRDRPKSIRRAYFFAYLIDSAQHNYISAIRNYKKNIIFKDSISEATKNRQLQELQVQYETEKREKENSFLRKESLLQANRVKQADRIRDLTLAGIMILLIFISLLYYSYRINQRNSKAIGQKNDSLKQLVTEKEWLLKEIHHRVKNNLQIVMGLLQRQSAYIDNDEALAAIQNSENRMHSIALIHQKLYQSDNLDLIFMPEYINEMLSYLKDSSGLDNRIFFEKQIDKIYLDVTQAVPLGLILNEAMTNAIKYAYPIDATGIIYVSMINGPGQHIELTIADNGPGLPVGFDIHKVDSLGINLMRGLSKQMGATFDIVNEAGCVINIGFKAEIFNRGIAEITLT